jgi:hypothetical protein
LPSIVGYYFQNFTAIRTLSRIESLCQDSFDLSAIRICISHRYRGPYEGTDVAAGTMQAYLDWEYGRVEQLGRDATDGLFVI